jgi:hypothetical protein
MPLTFAEAKSIVSPNKPITPGSKEHKDILEMMRQSGKVFPEDNIPTPPPVVYARTEAQFRNRLSERPNASLPQARKGVSKREWLSIDANKNAYEEHLKTHQQVPVGALVPEPRHLEWADKIAPKINGKISKREWISQLK